MARHPAGLGKKRPQIDIPIDRVDLDNQNPRFAEEHKKATQPDLMQILYEEFDLPEIAYSMAVNGYFDEEPIVVVPTNLPKSFKWSDDVNELQTSFEELLEEKNSTIRFTVVEGNRRIATARLLTSSKLRSQLKVQPDEFPVVKDARIIEDLKNIPSIVYKERKEVSPYLERVMHFGSAT